MKLCTLGTRLTFNPQSQVLAWVQNDIPLVGDARDYYAKASSNGMEASSLSAEALVAFLCLGLPQNFDWYDDEGAVVDRGYPKNTWDLRPCGFTQGEVQLSLEDRESAKRFVEAICCASPFTFDDDGYAPPKPQWIQPFRAADLLSFILLV
jgi:hypothetical protein